jgi:hypothetical protein
LEREWGYIPGSAGSVGLLRRLCRETSPVVGGRHPERYEPADGLGAESSVDVTGGSAGSVGLLRRLCRGKAQGIVYGKASSSLGHAAIPPSKGSKGETPTSRSVYSIDKPAGDDKRTADASAEEYGQGILQS